jgi:membrane-bound ClpP family serine protease
MVAVVDLLGLLVIVLANSAVSALLTRFFRVRLHTSWGTALYVVLVTPVVLLVVVLVLSGVLGLGGDVGSPGLVVGMTVVVPLALGVTFDYFWMPTPEAVDLPDPSRGAR